MILSSVEYHSSFVVNYSWFVIIGWSSPVGGLRLKRLCHQGQIFKNSGSGLVSEYLGLHRDRGELAFKICGITPLWPLTNWGHSQKFPENQRPRVSEAE